MGQVQERRGAVVRVGADPGPLSVGGLMQRVGGSLLLNVVCPWAAFQLLTGRGVSAIVAVAATAVFPMVGTTIGWVRLGRPDVLGLLSILFIVVSVIVAFVADNPLVILLRGSVTNTIFAGLCFGSLAFGRPLMFYVSRQYVAGWNHERFERFAANWEHPEFQASMRRITVGWGCWLIVQAIGRVVAAHMMDITTLLAVWPFVSNVGTVAMIIWSFRSAQTNAGGSWDPIELGPRFGAVARDALDRAVQEAKRQRLPYVGTEHMMIALTEGDTVAARALRRVSVTPETARITLESSTPSGTTPPWQVPTLAPRLRSALRRALTASQAAGAREIASEHLLLGLLDEPDSRAVTELAYMGVDVARLRARLASGSATPPQPAPE